MVRNCIAYSPGSRYDTASLKASFLDVDRIGTSLRYPTTAKERVGRGFTGSQGPVPSQVWQIPSLVDALRITNHSRSMPRLRGQHGRDGGSWRLAGGFGDLSHAALMHQPVYKGLLWMRSALIDRIGHLRRINCQWIVVTFPITHPITQIDIIWLDKVLVVPATAFS